MKPKGKTATLEGLRIPVPGGIMRIDSTGNYVIESTYDSSDTPASKDPAWLNPGLKKILNKKKP